MRANDASLSHQSNFHFIGTDAFARKREDHHENVE